MNSVAIVLLSVLLVAQNFGRAGAVPRFEVDLDVPARQRWTHVTEYWRDHLIAMGKTMVPMIRDHLGDDFEAWCAIADKAFDEDFHEELVGMAETLNDPNGNLTWSKLTQLLYEVGSPTLQKMCSGVLWAMKNGTVIHGRNMDYMFLFNMTDNSTGETRTLNWPDVTYEVLFKRNGKPLYIATMWPGSVGISTAMRFDGWAFEQNTRHNNNAKDNLPVAQAGGKVHSLVARRVMENTSDFEEALQRIYDEKYMAPQYFVMSGKGAFEGAVLTIDRFGKHKDSSPPVMRVDNSSGGWYLVQTNDDQGTLTMDPRQPIANIELEHMDRDEISVTHMQQFMHTPLLFNPGTVFSTIMVPATGYYHTILPNETVGMYPNVQLHLPLLLEERSIAVPASRAKRRRLLRGAHSEADSADSDNAALMQVSVEQLEL